MSDETAAPLGVTDAEMQTIESGAAIYSNKFYVTLTGPMARITFTEQVSVTSAPKFRSAVAMTLGDMLQLRDVLNRMTAEIQMIDLSKVTGNVATE